jgi:hypothetical protein
MICRKHLLIRKAKRSLPRVLRRKGCNRGIKTGLWNENRFGFIHGIIRTAIKESMGRME